MVKELLDSCPSCEADEISEQDGEVEGADDKEKADKRREEVTRRVRSVSLEAAMKGSAAVVAYLVEERGLRAENTPDQLADELDLAAGARNIKVMYTLITKASASMEPGTYSEGVFWTHAIAGGHEEIAKWLLDRGTLAVTWDDNPEVIFLQVVESGNVEIMQILFDAAEKMEHQRPSRFSIIGSLPNAARSASSDMMKLVLEMGGFGQAVDNTEQQRKASILAIAHSMRNNKTDQACLQLAIDTGVPRDERGDL